MGKGLNRRYHGSCFSQGFDLIECIQADITTKLAASPTERDQAPRAVPVADNTMLTMFAALGILRTDVRNPLSNPASSEISVAHLG